MTIHCPICGKPMTVDGVVTMPRSGRTYTQLTCDTKDCAAWKCTTSDLSVLSGDFVRQWSFEVRFDTQTGAPIG